MAFSVAYTEVNTIIVNLQKSLLWLGRSLSFKLETNSSDMYASHSTSLQLQTTPARGLHQSSWSCVQRCTHGKSDVGIN